jgi:hypothetical protein
MNSEKILRNLGKKITGEQGKKNIKLIKCKYYECVADKDYYPFNENMFMKFLLDSDVKKILD